MKRILYALNYLPWPPVSGGRKVSLATLRELGTVAPIDVICFDHEASPDRIEELKTACPGLDRVFTVPYRRASRLTLPFMNLLGRPWFLYRDRSGLYSSMLSERVASGQYDLVFTDTLRVAANVIPVLMKRPPGVRWVSQLHNVNTVLTKRFLNRHPWLWPVLYPEYRLLQRLERDYWRMPDRTVFISATDRRIAETIIGETDRWFDAFPGSLLDADAEFHWDGGDNFTLLHVGTGSWAPNVDGIAWFLKRVFPLVKDQVPGVRFIHAGKDTGPELSRLSAGECVKIHGFVDDLDPLYRQASAFVVPLRFGSGIKIKILDALSRGVPVVTTSIGREGIPVSTGDGVLVGDTPEEIAAHVLTLLKDSSYRLEMGRRARDAAIRLAANDRLPVLIGNIGDDPVLVSGD